MEVNQSATVLLLKGTVAEGLPDSQGRLSLEAPWSFWYKRPITVRSTGHVGRGSRRFRLEGAKDVISADSLEGGRRFRLRGFLAGGVAVR